MLTVVKEDKTHAVIIARKMFKSNHLEFKGRQDKSITIYRVHVARKCNKHQTPELCQNYCKPC